MKMVKISELTLDSGLWPRMELNAVHVGWMANMLAGGASLPPIIVDQRGRVIDGWHRIEAHKHLKREEIACEAVTYEDDAACYADAVARNVVHGRNLTSYELTSAALKLQEMGWTVERIADAIHMSRVKIDGLLDRTVVTEAGREPLKRGIPQEYSGSTVTPRQQRAIKGHGGMQATYYVRQVLTLLETGLWPHTEAFREEMDKLMALWKDARRKKAAG